MPRWLKRVLISTGVLLVSFAVAGFFAFRHFEKVIRECYAQWGTAEMILAYVEDQRFFRTVGMS